MRWYVGCSNTASWEAFKWFETPTPEIFPQYKAVIGPFRTMRAAKYMAIYGPGNPHLQHVRDAERQSKGM